MFSGYSDECNKVIKRAAEIAERSSGLLGTEHLIAAMLSVKESNAYKYLSMQGLSYEVYAAHAIEFYDKSTNSYSLSARVQKMINDATIKARNAGMSELTSEFILYEILSDTTSYGTAALIRLGVDVATIRNKIKNIGSKNKVQEVDVTEKLLKAIIGEDFHKQMQNEEESSSKGGVDELSKYGVDLTQRAKEGRLDPVIGRKEEVDRIIQILSRRTKNNPVLIGEPGVGKSAVVEGLAQAIAQGEVPSMLKGKTIFSLDLASMIAGTKYRGEFEERITKLINTIKENKDIILFIDEIHMIVGAGETSEGTMDAANILKPQLARGELQTIGATTIEEYRKFIEKDAALERRFQPITVDPPTVEDTIVILKGLREKYEKHHNVEISDNAIEAAAKLSDRYISDRFLPDKAIDLIDEAASRKHIGACVLPKSINDMQEEIARLNIEKESASKIEDYDKAAAIKNKIIELKSQFEQEKKKWDLKQKEEKLVLQEEDIAAIVSSWTKIPLAKLTQSEADVLLGLENVLKNRVVGQDEAVVAISKAVRRARVGIKDPKRPIGSFIFLGPTGVGKTELSKALAESMFGDENLMIRIDMSEYMESHNVSKLIGSAPGYVGFEEGGQLTEKVRRNPYSVVLFDEIEKAHPEVFNILLQILEDGRLTDSHGRVVSFKNTIIILTSNIGAQDIKKKSVGFGDATSSSSYEDMKERQLEALRRTLKPEFINRIDDIIVFRSFEKEDMYKIAALMARSLEKRLKDRGINVTINDDALNIIIEKGFNVEYGARPLRRALTSMVEDELATRMLKGEFALGDEVEVGGEENNLTFNKK